MFALQESVVVALVGAAVVYLAYRVWLVAARRQSGGCGGGQCAGCPSGEENAAAKGFVPLEQLGDLRSTNGER